MPLPNAGQIDLNAMHVEAGGTSATEAGINDADIRGLLNPTPNSGSQMDFADWYGASAGRTIPIDFYEHGFGSNIGDVRVYIVDSTGGLITPITGAVSSAGYVYQSIGQFSTSSTTPFRRVQKTVTIAANQSYRILHTVINGNSFRGDYAVRDLLVGGTRYDFASNATGWLTSTTITSASGAAAFTSAQTVATASKRQKWNRRTGSTPSSSTGPTTASGTFYVYAETSGSGNGIFYLFSPLVT